MKIVVAVALALSLFAPSLSVLAAPDCQVDLGFASIARLIPEQVGSCVDTPAYDDLSGEAVQHTSTGGLFMWRKGDNWTAFTDGYHTWVIGPNGLQERLNSERFPWETASGTMPAPSASALATAAYDGNQGSTKTEDDVAVPSGYPPMSALSADARLGCLHLAQDLEKAGTGVAVRMRVDDQLCPYFADPNWPGFA